MPIPTFEKFIEPILRFLMLHPDGITVSDIYPVVAAELKLSEEDKQLFLQELR